MFGASGPSRSPRYPPCPLLPARRAALPARLLPPACPLLPASIPHCCSTCTAASGGPAWQSPPPFRCPTTWPSCSTWSRWSWCSTRPWRRCVGGWGGCVGVCVGGWGAGRRGRGRRWKRVSRCLVACCSCCLHARLPLLVSTPLQPSPPPVSPPSPQVVFHSAAFQQLHSLRRLMLTGRVPPGRRRMHRRALPHVGPSVTHLAAHGLNLTDTDWSHFKQLQALDLSDSGGRRALPSLLSARVEGAQRRRGGDAEVAFASDRGLPQSSPADVRSGPLLQRHAACLSSCFSLSASPLALPRLALPRLPTRPPPLQTCGWAPTAAACLPL